MLRLGLICVLTFTAFLPARLTAREPANTSFEQTWSRTDRPVTEGHANRTWIWGPQGITGEVREPYAEASDGSRTVQYFDKSRMEISNPSADSTSVWYVTNGLLVSELISGNIQVGDDSFEQRPPARVQVAGDAGQADPSPTPTSRRS